MRKTLSLRLGGSEGRRERGKEENREGEREGLSEQGREGGEREKRSE